MAFFLRAFLRLSLLLLCSVAAVVTTNGQGQGPTWTVNLGGQLVGTTLEYTVNTMEETVTMMYTVPHESWISIGFSNTGGSMIGSYAVVGLPATDQVLKYSMSSYVQQTGVLPFPDAQQTLRNTSIVQDGSGQTTLTFTKSLKDNFPEYGEVPINSTGGSRTTLLGAYGYTNMFAMHQARQSFALDLGAGAAAEKADVAVIQTRKQILWQIHGWCAAVAWGICAPLAIGAALLRSWFPDTSGGLWFRCHQTLNYLVIGLTTISFVIAVVAINQETPAGRDPYNFSTQFPHRCVGLIVFLLVVVQGVGGHFRPPAPPPPVASASSSSQEEEENNKSMVRTGWEISHRVLGITVLAMSWYQIDSGIHIYQSLFVESQTINLRSIFWGITGTVSGVIVVCYSIIRINKKYRNNKDNNNNNNKAAAAEDDDETPKVSQQEDDNDDQQQKQDC